MRKVMIIMLAIALILSLSACNGKAQDESTAKTTSRIVQLTSSNIKNYLSFNFEIKENLEAELTVYPTVGGSFNNVEIDFTVNPQAVFRYHLDYDDRNEALEDTIVLPASGDYSKTYEIYSNAPLPPSSFTEYNSTVWIVSVSGTFTPAG